MKNKILLLIVIFIFSIVNVYALDDEKISITVGDVDVPVYNVEVYWDSMEFSYNEQVNFVWNNETYTYELEESTYYWSNSNNSVDIFNKSSYSMNVELDYIVIDQDISGSFDIDKAKLTPGSQKNFKLNLNGELSTDDTDYIKVGTIELSIS